uniref:Uncharacterized protein n=1 Tax=Oryza punctata TaxID=4537 RepID=A0A0E0JVZ1_ORYPU
MVVCNLEIEDKLFSSSLQKHYSWLIHLDLTRLSLSLQIMIYCPLISAAETIAKLAKDVSFCIP